MSKTLLITAAALAASINARHPNLSQEGVLKSLSASGDDEKQIDSLQAAGVRAFTEVTGNLVYVKAIDNFLLGGETITTGTIVQVREEVSRELLRMNRVAAVSAAEVAEAQAK